MNNMFLFKRLVAVTVLIAAFVSAFSQQKWDGSVASSFVNGIGSQQDPFVIASPAELAFLAESVNKGNNYQGKYLRLDVDIDLDRKVWTPIGNDVNPFRGNFNGNSRTVANLYVDLEQNNFAGLFGYTGSGSYITYLGIIGNGSITGNENVGAIVGRSNGNVENCYNTLQVSGNQRVGGIVGGNNGSIKYCYNTGRVIGVLKLLVGGIVGEDIIIDDEKNKYYGVDNCYFDTQTTVQKNANGSKKNRATMKGLFTREMTRDIAWNVNFDNGTWRFENLMYPMFKSGTDVSMAILSATPFFLIDQESVDGIKANFTVGLQRNVVWNSLNPEVIAFNGSTAVVTRIYSENVTITCSLNGVVREVVLYIIGTKLKLMLEITGDGKGKIENEGVEYKSGYIFDVADGQTKTFEIIPAEGCFLSAINFGSQSDYNVISDYKNSCLHYTTPQIGRDVTLTFVFDVVKPWDGSQVAINSPSGDYLIYRPEELAWFAAKVNSGDNFYGKEIKLMNNMDLAGINWLPIGTTQVYDSKIGFGGMFNGNEMSVSNLHVGNLQFYTGLFGIILQQGSVIDLGVESGDVNGAWWVGGIAGDNRGVIKNCLNRSAINLSENNGGGIAGFNNGGTISGCRNEGNVSANGNNVGGITGYNYNGVLEWSFNYGNVVNTGAAESTDENSGKGYYTGGIVGLNVCDFGGGVSDCSNAQIAVISSKLSSLGGIVGQNGAGTIKNCHNGGKVSAEGTLGTDVGGIVGLNKGNVTDCWNKGEIVSKAAYTGGITGSLIGKDASIFQCYNVGNISSDADNVGGVTGEIYMGGVSNAFNMGSVKGMNNVGGVAGLLSGGLSNSYNSGSVDGVAFAGGIVGLANEGSAMSYCYNRSEGVSSVFAPLSGNFDGSGFSFNNCYYDNVVCNRTDLPAGVLSNGRSSEQMKSGQFVSLLNSLQSTQWKADYMESVNDGYPILLWQKSSDGICGDLADIEVALYPNPTNGQVVIESLDIKWIYIYGISGNLVEKLQVGSDKVVVDLTRLGSGIYFLNVVTAEGTITRKVVKK